MRPGAMSPRAARTGEAITQSSAPQSQETAASFLSGPIVLHPCGHAGCGDVAFLARCRRHAPDGEHRRLEALSRAVAEAIELEERWMAAQASVAELEADLGIVRAPAAQH